jgi:hypothetical protein
MGGKSSTERNTLIENQVKLQINIKISNITNNMNSVMTKQINETISNLQTELKTNVGSTSRASNDTTIQNLKVSGKNSKFSLEQDANLSSEFKALVSICSDMSSMEKLASSLTDNIKNNTTNESSAANDLKILSALSSKTSDAGGPEKIVADVTNSVSKTLTGMMNSLTGSETNDTQNTTIRNTIDQQINTEIENTTNNTTKIEHEIKNAIANSIKQQSETGCLGRFNASNNFNLGDVEITDGAVAELKQKVSVSAISECIVKMNLGSKVVNDLFAGSSVVTTSDTSNKNKADNKIETEQKTTVIDEKKSSIMDTILYIGLAFAGVVVIGIIIGGILFATGAIRLCDFGIGKCADDDEDLPEYNELEQTGGYKPKTTYLLLSILVALFYLYKVSKKSFFIVGTILLMYFSYKIKLY